MYAFAMDADECTIVVRFSGRVLTEDEYLACYRDFVTFVEVTRPDRSVLALIIVAKECPAPNAAQRARFVEMGRGLEEREVDYIFVTESAVSRGVLTAIRWLRPKRPNHHDQSFGTVAQATEWISANTKRHHVTASLLARVLAQQGDASSRGGLLRFK